VQRKVNSSTDVLPYIGQCVSIRCEVQHKVGPSALNICIIGFKHQSEQRMPYQASFDVSNSSWDVTSESLNQCTTIALQYLRSWSQTCFKPGHAVSTLQLVTVFQYT